MCLDSGGSDSGKEMRQQEAERQARIRQGTNAVNEIFGGDLYSQKPNPALAPKPVPVATSPSTGAHPGIFGNRPTSATAPGIPSPTQHATPVVGPRINLFNHNIPLWEKSGSAPGQFGEDFFANAEKDYLDYYLPQYDRQAGDADRALRINLARSGNIGSSVGARQVGRLAEDKQSNRQRLVDESIKYSSGERKKLEDTRGNLIGQLESGAGIDNVANQAAAQFRSMTAPPAFSPLGDLFKNYTAAVANASIASGQPGFPGAEQYRRNLLFNIPSTGGSSGSSKIIN